LAHADCRQHFAAWVQALHPGRALDTDHAVCKVWPADPARTLAVLPLAEPGASTDETLYDLEVLVADSRTGALLAHRYEPSAIRVDTTRLESIALDTAQWQLAPRTRAFGVKISYAGPSRVAPSAATTLSLYVSDGAGLRRVLDNLVIQQSAGDWDGICAGRFSATERALALGPAARNGYATLRISAKTIDTVNTPAGDQCHSKDQAAKRASSTLQYDGTRYDVPAALRYNLEP
jgi:hypothetical protein